MRLAVCLAVVAAACSAESSLLEPPVVPPVPVPPVEFSVPLPPQGGEVSSSTVEPPVAGPAGEPLDEGGGSGAGEGAGGGDELDGGVGAPPPVVPVVPEGELEEPGAGGPDGGFQGVFVDVSAGAGYSCGLREGGSVECWEWGRPTFEHDWRGWSGDPVDVLPPVGVFASVSAGWGNACGLRPSGELECWGPNRSEVVSPPSGVFSGVSVGVEHACGVRPGGRLECWGSSGRLRPVGLPPDGVFLDFAVGRDFGCGVRSDRSVECWGEGFSGRGEPYWVPEGEFVSVHADGSNVCGLRLGGEVRCWGNFSDAVSYIAPSGEFASLLGVHYSTACGLRPGGEVICWRGGKEGEFLSWEVPDPEVGSPISGEGGACGAHFTGKRFCFGSGSEAGPSEEVSGIVGYKNFRYPVGYTRVGYEYYCGLRPGGGRRSAIILGI